jgi:hypothetical protein
MSHFRPLEDEDFAKIDLKDMEFIEFDEAYEVEETVHIKPKKIPQKPNIDIEFHPVEREDNILNLLESSLYSKMMYNDKSQYIFSSVNLENSELDGLCGLRRIRMIDHQTTLLDLCFEMNYSWDVCIVIINYMIELNQFELVISMISKKHLIPWIAYLKRMGNQDLLEKVYLEKKMYREYFYLQLKGAVKDIDELEKLFRFTNQYLKGSFESVQIQEYLKLLKLQVHIEEFDQTARNQLFVDYPRWNIINTSVQKTIYYLLFYHANAASDKISSPSSLKNKWKIGDKRYTYVAFQVKARIGDWDGLKSLVPLKGLIWKSFSLPFSEELLLDLVYTEKAPKKVMEYFIELEGNVELKLYYCVQYQCFEIGIKACEQMKNREKLTQLRIHVERLQLPHIVNLIDKSLNSPDIWKSGFASYFKLK